MSQLSSDQLSKMPPPFCLPCPLVLVGFMGVGKSTLGKKIAQRLQIPFIDTDTEIERQSGLTVAEIFAVAGEAAFRDSESRIIADCFASCGIFVMATGGGAFITPANRSLIHQKGISLWLKAEIELLISRLQNDMTRPLLASCQSRVQTIEKLFQSRYPIYAEADLTINCKNDEGRKLIDETMDKLFIYVQQEYGKL